MSACFLSLALSLALLLSLTHFLSRLFPRACSRFSRCRSLLLSLLSLARTHTHTHSHSISLSSTQEELKPTIEIIVEEDKTERAKEAEKCEEKAKVEVEEVVEETQQQKERYEEDEDEDVHSDDEDMEGGETDEEMEEDEKARKMEQSPIDSAIFEKLEETVALGWRNASAVLKLKVDLQDDLPAGTRVFVKLGETIANAKFAVACSLLRKELGLEWKPTCIKWVRAVGFDDGGIDWSGLASIQRAEWGDLVQHRLNRAQHGRYGLPAIVSSEFKGKNANVKGVAQKSASEILQILLFRKFVGCKDTNAKNMMVAAFSSKILSVDETYANYAQLERSATKGLQTASTIAKEVKESIEKALRDEHTRKEVVQLIRKLQQVELSNEIVLGRPLSAIHVSASFDDATIKMLEAPGAKDHSVELMRVFFPCNVNPGKRTRASNLNPEDFKIRVRRDARKNEIDSECEETDTVRLNLGDLGDLDKYDLPSTTGKYGTDGRTKPQAKNEILKNGSEARWKTMKKDDFNFIPFPISDLLTSEPPIDPQIHSFPLSMRHAAGAVKTGSIKLVFLAKSKLLSRSECRSFCTMLAGREPGFIMLPDKVDENDILLLVVGENQWRKDQKNYTKIFRRDDKLQLGIVIVDSSLIPDGSGSDVSHRRLVSMRIALQLLYGVCVFPHITKDTATSVELKVPWKQW